MAVNIQRQVGGSLADILDMVADTVRQRQQFARKVRALTAMGRMSAYVLVGMPLILLACHLRSSTRPYMSPALARRTGKATSWCSFGLISMAIGAAHAQKDRLLQGVGR